MTMTRAGRFLVAAALAAAVAPMQNPSAQSPLAPQSTHVSAWARLQAATIAQGTPEERAEARTRGDVRIDALGSGSDFTPFLQHSGVATLNLGYGGESRST